MGSGAFLVEDCRQLGDALLEAWAAPGGRPALPPDEDEVVFARRLVAQRCLYGVDRNPVSVDLAKVSLWLVALSKDHAFTFLDHALRHGDSLVGLTRKQIAACHWDPDAAGAQLGFETVAVHQSLQNVAELRQLLREAEEGFADEELRSLWDAVQFELDGVHLLGDLVLAAFFEAGKPKDRDARRKEYAIAVINGQADGHRGRLEERKHAEPPLAPFHGEIEFPEVFDRPDPGFDALGGNPPFAGKNTVAAANVEHYPAWLQSIHPESHGNADLAAHFFPRAFNRVRDGGTFGLIATTTIAQGDTRAKIRGFAPPAPRQGCHVCS